MTDKVSLIELDAETQNLLKMANGLTKKTLCIIGSVNLGIISHYLRNRAAKHAVDLQVVIGSYDNPIQDAKILSDEHNPEYVVCVPFFDLLLPAFEAKCTEISELQIEEMVREFASRWTIATSLMPGNSQIIIFSLHPLFSGYPIVPNRRDEIIRLFNDQLFMLTQRDSRIKLISSQILLSELGNQNSLDSRMYYRGKSPYRNIFLGAMADAVADALGNYTDNILKVLAVDLDNTLWGGVLGEVGVNGIDLNPYDAPGNVFYDVQHRIVGLVKLGIILVILSKNNEEEALEVLNEHPHNILKSEYFVAKRINWTNKADNLIELSTELAIGLESIALLDDSIFECEEVRRRLPTVSVFQVPEKLHDYPSLLGQIRNIFLRGQVEQRIDKTSQYLLRTKVLADQSEFLSHSDYLSSLGLTVDVQIDSLEVAQRAAELTLKTNQYNLTTIRRSKEVILDFMKAVNSHVLTFIVSDKYGNHGTVGLCILEMHEEDCVITDFLLSCRVIGRDIELAMLQVCAEIALKSGKNNLVGHYRPSGKNSQSEAIYNQDCFTRLKDIEDSMIFTASITQGVSFKPDWVAVSIYD